MVRNMITRSYSPNYVTKLGFGNFVVPLFFNGNDLAIDKNE